MMTRAQAVAIGRAALSQGVKSSNAAPNGTTPAYSPRSKPRKATAPPPR